VNEGGRERAGQEVRLEQRLLQAAEDLLAHQGRRVMSVSFPNVDPPLFIVVGETPQLAELLAAATRKVRGEDF
jgi:predicted transcriptional regulator